MAEFVLNVRKGATYENGDVLCAFNDERIKNVHAEHVCHPWKQLPDSDGILPVESLTHQYHERMYEYRFMHIGNTVVRLNLITGTTEDVTADIDIDLFFKIRFANKTQTGATKKPIFGQKGAEIWYGGHMRTENVDAVWNDIEERTPLRKAEHSKYPLTEIEKRRFLAVPMNDFTNHEASEYTSPIQEAGKLTVARNGELVVGSVTTANRKYKVNWGTLSLPVSPVDVQDTSREIDIRDVSPFETTIALNKLFVRGISI